MTAEVVYTGDLRCELTHLKSQQTFHTDAPTDNHGKGEAFSPTDLLATSLGACMMSIMGIAARTQDLKLEGTKISVTKIMASDPRRVSEVHCTLHFPQNNFSEKEKKILENAARTCPVALSLHTDIKQVFEFIF